MKISKYHKTIFFCCVVFAAGNQAMAGLFSFSVSDPHMRTPRPIKQKFLITFHNQNNKSLQAALRYQAKDGQWLTGGWYKLDPNEKKSIAKTDNAIVYVYAESIAPKDSRIILEWNRSLLSYQ